MREQAVDDLAFIRRVLDENRGAVVDRGAHLLIWGVLTALGLVLTWFVATGALTLSIGWVWGAIMLVGWIASFAIGWRHGRRARVRTLAGRVLATVWIASAITLTLVALAGLFGGALGYEALPGVLSVVVAVPVVLTAVLTGERWLGAVAAGWWLAGGVMLFVPGMYRILLMAALALLLMAVPGAVLRARSGRGVRTGVAAPAE
jgi:hypothetical protein